MRQPQRIGVPLVQGLMLTGRTLLAEEALQVLAVQYPAEDGAGLAKALELARKAAMTNFAVIHALPDIAEANPAAGFLTESLMAAIAETLAVYREFKIGPVMFSPAPSFETGDLTVPNDGIAEAACKLIESGAVEGFKFQPTCQGVFPSGKLAYGRYELFNHHKLPATSHTGHSGIGTGIRLKFS